MLEWTRRAPATRIATIEELELRTMLSAAHNLAVPKNPPTAPLTIAAKSAAKTVVSKVTPVTKITTTKSTPIFRTKPVAPAKPKAAKFPPAAKTPSKTTIKTAAKTTPKVTTTAPVFAPLPAPPSTNPAPSPAFLLGDVNNDGKVDTADFKIVNDHMGQHGLTLAQGDLTGDGVVNFSDFQVVEENFGKITPRYNYATIGQNLDGISDYGTIGAFGDLTRVFRNWGRPTTPYESDPTIQRTPENYPLEDAGAMTYALTYPDGVYKVSWDGQADLRFEGMGSQLTVTSHDGDHFTADLSLDHHLGEILNIYISNVNVNDPLHNLHIMSPDMDYSVSDTFRPIFLQKLAAFNGPLRMMDWMQTNWNPAVNSSDRTSPNNFSNAVPTGVDYESIIKLANTVHKDIWINVPYHANDDYVFQMADLFRDNLDPSLHLYVEFSNEVWNSGTFQQALDNTAIAKDDPDITVTDDFTRSAQEAGKQFARISSIFQQEFGPGAFGDRLRPVFGGFIATSYWSQQAMGFIQDHYGDPKNFAWAISVAPYVGVQGDMNVVDNSNLTLDGLFDWMNNFIDQKLGPWIAQNKLLANTLHMRLMAYEGGQSLQSLNGQNEAIKVAAQDDPRMGDVYTHLIRTWYDNSGGGIFENFSLATPYTPYGYWGVLQSITDGSSVKLDAVLKAIG